MSDTPSPFMYITYKSQRTNQEYRFAISAIRPTGDDMRAEAHVARGTVTVLDKPERLLPEIDRAVKAFEDTVYPTGR